ncbi:MAG: Gfo/Idh/MocA family oxidoreductase [Candidatus Latescibacterota bacterium]|nr:MAG: Gfo/Idh/MocA family oxidoreductase [Candidatus Latescibacterota bacterium]
MILKVAIVGCGKIADGHIEEIKKLKNARVVAVSDVEQLMAEQLAARYQVPAHYDDFERMLENERPDVIHITTPPRSHLSLATTAIEAGCHVLVEKPVGVDYAETHQLVRFAEASRKKLTVGYTYVFDPPAVALRELIRRGHLGDPIHVESYYGYDLSGVFGRAVLESEDHWVHSLPGKLLQNNLDHVLNKFTEFIPDERPSVYATAYKRRREVCGDTRDDVFDELRAVIVGENTSAYATLSSHGKPAGHFLRFYGTKSAAHVDYIARTVTIDGRAKLPSAIGRLMPAFSQSRQYFREGCKNVLRFARSEFQFFAGLNRLIASFYDSIIAGSAPPISYGEILRVAWLIDRVVEEVERSRADKKK